MNIWGYHPNEPSNVPERNIHPLFGAHLPRNLKKVSRSSCDASHPNIPSGARIASVRGSFADFVSIRVPSPKIRCPGSTRLEAEERIRSAEKSSIRYSNSALVRA